MYDKKIYMREYNKRPEVKARKREWRKNNLHEKERASKYSKEYNQRPYVKEHCNIYEKSDRRKKQKKTYYLLNKEKISKYNKSHYQKNRDYYIKYHINWHKKNKDKVNKKISERNKKNLVKVRQEILNILGRECSICHYNKYEVALDIHHKNPNLESIKIKDRVSRYKRILNEVRQNPKDFAILCSNCHRAVTHKALLTHDIE